GIVTMATLCCGAEAPQAREVPVAVSLVDWWCRSPDSWVVGRRLCLWPDQLPGRDEHSVKHVPGEAARLGVLAAGMVGHEQGGLVRGPNESLTVSKSGTPDAR